MSDPFGLLRDARTRADNFDLSTEAIVKHLQGWQKVCSFRLVEADDSSVTLRFETLPTDLDAFTHRVYELCPDVVDQGSGTLVEMAEMLEEMGQEVPEETRQLIAGVDLEDEDAGLVILGRELSRTRALRLWWD